MQDKFEIFWKDFNLELYCVVKYSAEAKNYNIVMMTNHELVDSMGSIENLVEESDANLKKIFKKINERGYEGNFFILHSKGEKLLRYITCNSQSKLSSPKS